MSTEKLERFFPDVAIVTQQESRDRISEERRLVICDRVWFAPVNSASCLMVETRSPFVSISGFQAEIWLGEHVCVADFTFASASTTKGDPLTTMHFRATKLIQVPTEYPSSPVPKLVLSGPDLPGSEEKNS